MLEVVLLRVFVGYSSRAGCPSCANCNSCAGCGSCPCSMCSAGCWSFAGSDIFAMLVLVIVGAVLVVVGH